MANERPLLPEKRQIPNVTRDTPPDSRDAVLSTRDHQVIREWARAVDAEPATGEATASGPAAALKVVDGGTGLRFNFPGVSPFREISWEEWFEHFNGHDLTFVYDNADPTGRRALDTASSRPSSWPTGNRPTTSASLAEVDESCFLQFEGHGAPSFLSNP